MAETEKNIDYISSNRTDIVFTGKQSSPCIDDVELIPVRLISYIGDFCTLESDMGTLLAVRFVDLHICLWNCIKYRCVCHGVDLSHLYIILMCCVNLYYIRVPYICTYY